MFIRVIVLLVIICVFAFIITQVIIPLFTGTKLFPLFNTKKASLLEEKEELLTELEIKRLRKENSDLAEKLKS